LNLKSVFVLSRIDFTHLRKPKSFLASLDINETTNLFGLHDIIMNFQFHVIIVSKGRTCLHGKTEA
jgi:hypothetical protein